MKKNCKKSISCLMAILIIIVGFAPNFVFASEGEIHDDYLIETILSKEEYTKQKITNKKTGKVEFLETHYHIDGTSYAIATSENEEYTIENDLNTIIVKKDNEIFEKIDITGISNVQEFDTEEINSSPITYSGYSWGPIGYRYSSTSFRVTMVSAGLGIVAAIFGLKPGASIVQTVVVSAIGLSLKQLYYKIGTQFRMDQNTRTYHAREITTIYSISNYTGKLGSNIKSWDTGEK